MGSRNEVVNGMTSTCGKASQMIESRNVFAFCVRSTGLSKGVVGRYYPIGGIGTLVSLQYRAGNPPSLQFPGLEFSA